MAPAKSFLDELRAFFGCRHVIPVGSGTAGLTLLLDLVDVRGKQVLLPALTCPNVAVAVVVAGGEPVLVDVDPTTYNISVDSTAEAMGPNVAAIIAVNSFGYPAEMDALRSLAVAHGAFLIDDACQAYGGRVEGHAVGARGDAGIVSFGYAKPVALHGGGLILTDSSSVADGVSEKLQRYRFDFMAALKNRVALNLMLKDRYTRMIDWGLKFALLEYGFPAGAARQLPGAWREFVDTMGAVRDGFSRMADMVSKIPGVVPFDYKGGGWLPWRFSFKTKSEGDRDQIEKRFSSVGIRTTRLYSPIIDFVAARSAASIATSEQLARTTANIACQTSEEDIQQVLTRLAQMSRGIDGR